MQCVQYKDYNGCGIPRIGGLPAVFENSRMDNSTMTTTTKPPSPWVVEVNTNQQQHHQDKHHGFSVTNRIKDSSCTNLFNLHKIRQYLTLKAITDHTPQSLVVASFLAGNCGKNRCEGHPSKCPPMTNTGVFGRHDFQNPDGCCGFHCTCTWLHMERPVPRIALCRAETASGRFIVIPAKSTHRLIVKKSL